MKLKKQIMTLLMFMTVGTSLYATEKRSLAVNINEWVLSNISREQEEEILQLEQLLNEKILHLQEKIAVEKEAYHIELHELEEYLSSQSIETLNEYVAFLALGIEKAKQSALEFYEVKNAIIEESLIQEEHNATEDIQKEENKEETSEEDKAEDKEETSEENKAEDKEDTSEENKVEDKEETSGEDKEEISEEREIVNKEENREENAI